MTDAQAAQAVKDLINGKGTPNPLNDLFQATYHWRLYVTQDVDLYAAAGSPAKPSAIYEKLATLPQVTIAETGITTYNIKSVEIDSTVGPNGHTRAMTATAIKMTVVEPMGMGFMDSIANACASLKIRNWEKCFYYLELSFMGYDASGGFVDNPVKSYKMDASNKWIWQMVITYIDVHFDAGGGTYNIAATPWAEGAALGDEYRCLPEQITVQAATIGELFEGIGKAMTDSYHDRNGNDNVKFGDPNKSPPVKAFKWYPITDAPSRVNGLDPAKFELKNKQPALSSLRGMSMDFTGSAGNPTARFQPGVSLDKMIEYALMNTEQAQLLVMDNDNKTGATDGAPSATNDRRLRESIVVRIEVDVIMGAYEAYSQQYQKTIVYHIHPYYTLAPITSKQQPVDAATPAVSGLALYRLLNKNYIKKVYNYLYTGLNTEVIDLDIGFNIAWSSTLPRLEGARLTYDQSDPAERANNTDEGGKEEVDQLKNKVLQLENQHAGVQASLGLMNAAKDQVNTLTAQLNNPNTSATQQASLKSQISALLLNGDLTKLIPVIKQLASQSSALESAISANLNKLTELGAAKTGPPNQYAEQMVNSPTAASSSTGPRLPLPVAFSQNYGKDDTGTGMVGQYHRDKSIFGAVLNQLYGLVPDKLMVIDMGIRGDPYWLGETNLARQVYMRPDTFVQAPPAVDQPNFFRGDFAFLLKFRYPEGQGANLEPVFNPDDLFNGIYIVVKVLNNFSDGVFKQTLHANRLPLISLKSALAWNGSMPPPATDAPAGGSGSSAARGGGGGSPSGSGNGSGPGAPSTNPSINAAVAHIDANATPSYAGQTNCAVSVREALTAGGYNMNGHPVNAADYGPTLMRNNFSQVADGSSISGFQPQTGDVAVLQAGSTPASAPGHICLYDGRQWVSGYDQRDVWGGPDFRRQGQGIAIYRPPSK